jgi:hypothetical protein
MIRVTIDNEPIAPRATETLLRNAHRLCKAKYRGVPLWAFVRDLTGHGSTVSIAVCHALGWNPHESGAKTLPPRHIESVVVPPDAITPDGHILQDWLRQHREQS